MRRTALDRESGRPRRGVVAASAGARPSTLEQLLSMRGNVVASTVIEKAPYTR